MVSVSAGRFCVANMGGVGGVCVFCTLFFLVLPGPVDARYAGKLSDLLCFGQPARVHRIGFPFERLCVHDS